MATTTTTATAADHLDPWGFGRCEDAPQPIVEHAHDQAAPVTLAALDARDAADAPAEFPPFDERHAATRAAVQVRAGTREWLLVLAVFAMAVLGQAFYIGFRLSGGAAPGASGMLVVSSHPAGLQVLVDGRLEGTTPVAMTSIPGRHHVEVGDPNGTPQVFEAEVVAGERWAQHVVAAGAATPSQPAMLTIDTGGAIAQVLVDGELIGTTPLERRDTLPGDHLVRVVYPRGAAVERRLSLAAGERVSLVLDGGAPRTITTARTDAAPRPLAPVAATPIAPALTSTPSRAATAVTAGASGFVRIEAPFEVEILEDGKRLGTSGPERLQIPAGGHALELVNDALGYRIVTKAVVLAGKVTTIPVDTPRAVVHVNAQPWAEVLVDGVLLGETPLANVLLPIGHHQLVLRHPELGERTQAFTVRANGPNRVAADLRR